MAGLDLAEFIFMEQTTPSSVGTFTLSSRQRSISHVQIFLLASFCELWRTGMAVDVLA